MQFFVSAIVVATRWTQLDDSTEQLLSSSWVSRKPYKADVASISSRQGDSSRTIVHRNAASFSHATDVQTQLIFQRDRV